METKNPLISAIEEKTSARDRALRDAQELETQISTLRNALAMTQPTAYEQFLKTQVSPLRPNVVQQKQEASRTTTAEQDGRGDSTDVDDIPKTRRGELRTAIAQALADGTPKTIDDVYAEVSRALGTATSRDSVRATLGILKNAGKVETSSYGSYRLSQSETPVAATTGVSITTSPTQGR